MSNLSLIELKLIAKNKGIKGYESRPEDKLLSALNVSVKMIKELKISDLSLTELKLIAKIRGIKGYENMSKDKLLSTFNKSKLRKLSEK